MLTPPVILTHTHLLGINLINLVLHTNLGRGWLSNLISYKGVCRAAPVKASGPAKYDFLVKHCLFQQEKNYLNAIKII